VRWQRKRRLQEGDWLAHMRASDPDAGHLEFTAHARRRLFERAVPECVVRQIVIEGAVVVRRADCAVLLGTAQNGRPLHVVVAYCGSSWRVVTVYRPDTRPWQWADGYTRRVSRWLPEGYED